MEVGKHEHQLMLKWSIQRQMLTVRISEWIENAEAGRLSTDNPDLVQYYRGREDAFRLVQESLQGL